MQLGPPVDRPDAHYVPCPEWYDLPIFQWSKYWHGATSIIGVLVIPSVLVAANPGAAFSGSQRGIASLEAASGDSVCVFVMFSLVGLGLRSQFLDRHDRGVAQQLAKQ